MMLNKQKKKEGKQAGTVEVEHHGQPGINLKEEDRKVLQRGKGYSQSTHHCICQTDHAH